MVALLFSLFGGGFVLGASIMWCVCKSFMRGRVK